MLPRLLCVWGLDEGLSHFWSHSLSVTGTHYRGLLTDGRLKHKSLVDFPVPQQSTGRSVGNNCGLVCLPHMLFAVLEAGAEIPPALQEH